MLITFEGADGVGKSTQIRLFASYLEQQQHNLILTREPGGTDNAEAIREFLLAPKKTQLQLTTELLLIYAARAEHWHHTIQPALKAGQIVVCDRFIDSTIAYQAMSLD
ncbi:MAG: dTMP kinase, partial [Pseudomonadota bacterium]